MNTVVSPPARSGGLRWFLALLLVVPALIGALHAGRLASSAWSVGGVGDDPIVQRVREFAGENGGPAYLPGYEEAVGRSHLDFRYPFRLGLHFYREPAGPGEKPTRLARARALLAEAVHRAPTHAIARLYLSDCSLRLGEVEEADEHLLAALELAPIWQTTRNAVADHFQSRRQWGRRTGGGAALLLAAALRVPSRSGRSVVGNLLADPLLSWEEARDGLVEARIPVRRALGLLERSDRWEWAKRYAWESGGDSADALQGEVRIRHAVKLAELGARNAALAEAEEGRRLLGGAFVAWETLASCRLAAGRTEDGLVALTEALEVGIPVSSASQILLAVDVPGPLREVFWQRRAARAGEDPEVSLEIARAKLDAGRATEVIPLLRKLADRAPTAGEASYLSARAFAAAGGRAIALKYARAAAAVDPKNDRYRSLLDELEEEEE